MLELFLIENPSRHSHLKQPIVFTHVPVLLHRVAFELKYSKHSSTSVHDLPSPTKPGLHEQLYEPYELLHTAYSWQSFIFELSMHSSMSARLQSKKKVFLFNFNPSNVKKLNKDSCEAFLKANLNLNLDIYISITNRHK